MKVLKKFAADDVVQLRVRIEKTLMAELETVQNSAKKKGLRFDVSEVVEGALRKAVKAAKKELAAG